MKLGIFFNTTEIGGAERSMISQAQIMKASNDLTCFIPNIGGTLLQDFLESKKLKCESFGYPKIFYGLSRSKKSNISTTFLATLNLTTYVAFTKINFNALDAVYLNGNKAAVFILLKLYFSRNDLKIYWHHRDYPQNQSMLKLIKLFLPFFKKLTIIANSYDVEKKLRETFINNKIQFKTIYNIVETKKEIKDLARNCIGIVAMSTPWKGIHWTILYALLYEKELIKLGITNVIIFTNEIYKTSGEHNNYYQQIKELSKKSKLILFKNNCDPSEMYHQIKVLIHSSIEPEPFGRVILEAQQTETVVISTSIGGSDELIDDELTGYKIDKFDYAGLHQAIEKVLLLPLDTIKMIKLALLKSDKINEESKDTIKELFN